MPYSMLILTRAPCVWELVALGCAVTDFARNNVFLALINGLRILGFVSRLRPKRRGVFLFTVLMLCFTVFIWLEVRATKRVWR